MFFLAMAGLIFHQENANTKREMEASSLCFEEVLYYLVLSSLF